MKQRCGREGSKAREGEGEAVETGQRCVEESREVREVPQNVRTEDGQGEIGEEGEENVREDWNDEG